MPSPLAEAFLMGILNGCYETPSKIYGTASLFVYGKRRKFRKFVE